jgi:two-component system sensor histidine kinase/response regulator
MKESILVIEDNDEIRESTSELLTLEGFEVTTADCGNDAINQTKINIPDLIICDIVMPGMDGFEVLIILKQDKRTQMIPFIFSTAKSEPVDRKRAKALGVSSYLIKPFDYKQLLQCIKETLMGVF